MSAPDDDRLAVLRIATVAARAVESDVRRLDAERGAQDRSERAMGDDPAGARCRIRPGLGPIALGRIEGDGELGNDRRGLLAVHDPHCDRHPRRVLGRVALSFRAPVVDAVGVTKRAADDPRTRSTMLPCSRSPPTRTASIIRATRSTTAASSWPRPRSPSAPSASGPRSKPPRLGEIREPDEFGPEPVLRVHTTRLPRVPDDGARALA